MPDVIPDLWPEDIVVTHVRTPLAILQHQAAQLREKTKNLLEAEVDTNRVEEHVEYYFELIAPALYRYRYRLFRVRHHQDMVYPALVEGTAPADSGTANTEQEFIELIGKVLRSNKAKAVIQSLIAQSIEKK
jgi:hypothetical protein